MTTSSALHPGEFYAVVTRNARRSDTLVYLGTVDDVVLRYPWPGIAIDENFLVETIVDHVLFGAPLLINDGYIVNHEGQG